MFWTLQMRQQWDVLENQFFGLPVEFNAVRTLRNRGFRWKYELKRIKINVQHTNFCCLHLSLKVIRLLLLDRLPSGGLDLLPIPRPQSHLGPCHYQSPQPLPNLNLKPLRFTLPATSWLLSWSVLLSSLCIPLMLLPPAASLSWPG